MGLPSWSSRLGSEERGGWPVSRTLAAYRHQGCVHGGQRDGGTEVGQERGPVLVMCCNEGFDEAMAWAPGG